METFTTDIFGEPSLQGVLLMVLVLAGSALGCLCWLLYTLQDYFQD